MSHRFIALVLVALWAGAAPLPTPEEFAGFRMGADKKLVRWERIVEYMRLADAASDRVLVEELGKSTQGNPFISVTVSAAGTIANLAPFKATQRRLAYPRDLEPAEFAKLAASHKAVLLITCNIHATEIGSSQMVLELIHRLATEDSPFISRVLDNVILVLVPSMNPDGQIMVTDWYNRNVGSPFEYSALPELYHKYTGHDNNRDAFMNTQAESKLINRLTYKDWFPHVFYDEHQMGSNGPRIFVPPFKNPINMNVDPLIWELNGMLGYAMGTALAEKDYSGVISDTMYTSWWQGGFLMQAWWHNMAGLLSEVASVAIATPLQQEKARLGEAPRGPEPGREDAARRDPRRPLPPPRDVTPRNTYPRPWLGGTWTLRNIVEYELAATYGVLEAMANNRDLLIRSFYNLNRKQIQLGTKEAPYAWVIPKTQHDPPAATRLAQILDELGVEVHQAGAEFKAGDRSYPAGSYVVLMAQPFRGFAKDLLERQKYPEFRPAPNGPIERPYDVTGWTLPLQMGVDAVEVEKPFQAPLELMKKIEIPAGTFDSSPKAAAYLISHATNNSVLAANRLLKSGAKVLWDENGDYVVTGAKPDQLREWTQQLGISVKGLTSVPSGRTLQRSRIAMYRPWLSNMDEGWTRWLLEQFEFEHSALRNEDIRKGRLRDRFDVIVFADQSKDSITKGAEGEWTRPEYRGGIGAEGVTALKEFVHSGGTLIAMGSSTLLPVEDFPLPLKNALKGLRPEQFSVPGSILKIFVDTRSPVGYGMREQVAAVFHNDVAFDPAPAIGNSQVRVVARYPGSGLLESGYVHGEQYLQDRIAAADVSFGSGRAVLLGFSVQNRAQPHGTFKLLFNAIHSGALTPQ